MKSVSVERGPDQMPRLLGRVGDQRGTGSGGLRALQVMGVLLLLLVGCAPGAGDKAPREAGQPVEEVPARGGSQAGEQPPSLPPAEPPQYVPPEKAPVYVQPGREPVYIPRPEGKPEDQPPERKGLKEQ